MTTKSNIQLGAVGLKPPHLRHHVHVHVPQAGEDSGCDGEDKDENEGDPAAAVDGGHQRGRR